MDPLPSAQLRKYFEDYSQYHQTTGNQISHYFGITFIVVSVLGLLSHCAVGTDYISGTTYLRLDGGTILLALGFIWYLFLDWKIAVPFVFVLAGLYFLGRTLSMQANWILFIVGWIFQGIGHAVYEKKAPAFFKNLTHLLIGPLWIFAKVIGYR